MTSGHDLDDMQLSTADETTSAASPGPDEASGEASQLVGVLFVDLLVGTFPPLSIRCRRGPFRVTRIEENHPEPTWPNPEPTWPNAAGARHVETCGAHFPRLMSLADALRTAGGRGDLRELYVLQCRQAVPPELVRVVDDTGVGLVPFGLRPLAGSDGGTTPAPDLGSLRRVGADTGLASDVARIGDSTAALGAGPQGERVGARWLLQQRRGRRSGMGRCLARLNHRLRNAMPS